MFLALQLLAKMAPIDKKRKSGPTNDSFARSKNPANKETRPTKRPRPDEEDRKPSTAPTKLSKVREEEAAFPRGGASVLTPLEHKQIQIEATQDVLFEQQGAQASRMEIDGEEGEEGHSAAKKQKSRGKGKNKKDAQPAAEEEDVVKIEGLSYKVYFPSILLKSL